MSNCKKLPYFEGLTDETIKQGSDFDPTEGVKAYDGYDEEIEYTYSPQELDTCLVGSQVIQYRASQTSEGDMLPNICIPDGLALALPSICDDYESTTAERIIRIIKANDPTIYGIPQVTVASGTAFNVLDGVTAVDDNGNPITDITYSGTLDKRVSGDIISIDDGDERYPVKSLEVELEPIQDLHGYDKPWAGGAGKNLFNPSTALEGYYISDDNGALISGNNSVASDYIDVTSGQSYMISPTLSSGNWGAWYDENKTFISGFTGYATAKAAPSNAKYLRFTVSRSGSNSNYATTTQVEEGSTPTAWSPYSNICPISGRTDVVAHRTGVNVWDEEWEVGGINAGGSLDTNPYRLRSKNYISIIPNTAYYFASDVSLGYSSWLIMCFYDGDKNFVSFLSPAVNRTFNTPSNARFMKFCTSDAWNGRTYEGGFSINYPSTDTDYHPYQGTTYTTDLGRTVYGGTLDVVSGELVVDRAMVDLGTLSWSRYTPSATNIPVFYAGVSGMLKANEGASLPLCSSYRCEAWTDLSRREDGTLQPHPTLALIYVADSRFDNVDSFASAVQGVQLVYELATPQTIQLTPQQVMLLTGDNNLWSDGEVEMVYSVELPTDGEVSYPLEGEYEITYSATDKCGNVGEAIRHITVE